MMLNAFDAAFLTARTTLGMTVDSILQGGQDAMENGGSFSGLSQRVDDIGGGGYHLVKKGGVYGLLIIIAISGLVLAFSKAHNREEAKAKIIWIIIGAAVFFGSVAILVALETVGQGLFENATTG